VYQRAKKLGQDVPPGTPLKLEIFQDTGVTLRVPREIDKAEEFKNINWTPCKVDHLPERPIKIEWNTAMKLRPYQVQPVADLVDHGSILNAPCGTGKTTMAIRTMTQIKQRTAIIVDLEILLTQWKSSLEQFTTLKANQIGQVGLGKNEPADVTLCMIQTLLRKEYAENKEFFDSFPLVIFDECHTTGALEYFRVINRFPGRRIGLTATIQRTDKLRTFLWSIGEDVVKVEGENFIPHVSFLPTDTYCPEKYYTFGGRVNDQVVRNILCKNQKRTDRIIAFIQKKIDEGRHMIVLTHRREHANVIFTNVTCTQKSLLIGKTTKKDPIQRVDHDDPILIVATFNFLAKGFDNDKMDTILFATPFGAPNTIQQAVGRILRIREGKKHPEVYDVYDARIPYCADLARHRESTYTKQKCRVVRGINQ